METHHWYTTSSHSVDIVILIAVIFNRKIQGYCYIRDFPIKSSILHIGFHSSPHGAGVPVPRSCSPPDESPAVRTRVKVKVDDRPALSWFQCQVVSFKGIVTTLTTV